MSEWITFTGLVALTITVITAIAKFSRWSGQVDADRDTFKDLMKEVREDLKNLRQNVDRILGKLGVALIKSSSPTQLTPLGEEVAKDLGAHEWAKEALPLLMEQSLDKAEWEIDQICFDFVYGQLPGEMPKALSRVAYERGIDRSSLLPLLQVVLRNAILDRLSSIP